MAFSTVLVVALVVTWAALKRNDPTSRADARPGTSSATSEDRPAASANGIALMWPPDHSASSDGASPTFARCPRTRPVADESNLDPVARIGPSNDHVPPRDIPHGDVRLERVASLRLTEGGIAAGPGFDVSTGLTQVSAIVADRTIDAPVTLAVLDSPQTGRRVAFAEIRLLASEPVRWVEERYLNIGTDGGDGGFADAAATRGDMEQQSEDYLDAMANATECVVRQESEGRVSGVIFATGYGDGGYPTLLGLDDRGRIATIVHDGLVLPWTYSGLPGAPPPDLG